MGAAGVARFLERFAEFSRVIRYDKRGTGLSDRTPSPPTLEQHVDDMRAVMGAAGSDRAAIVGWVDGAAAGVLCAATYPERGERPGTERGGRQHPG